MKENVIIDYRAEKEARAKEYFYNQKKRQPHFLFVGTSTVEDGFDEDTMWSRYYAFDPDEFARLAQRMLDVLNRVNPPLDSTTPPFKTLDEFDTDMDLFELKGCDPELDEKIFDMCEVDDLKLYCINQTPRYLYQMSCFYWDANGQKMSERTEFEVDLMDEEYLYLLNNMTQRSGRYTFNELIFDNPELAKKISLAADNKVDFPFQLTDLGHSFIVIFDEVIDDEKQIRDSMWGA